MSTVCRRFKYNAERSFPHHLKLWKDFPQNSKTSQFMLSKIGFVVKGIDVYNNDEISIQQTMDLIEKNCKNLEKINLHHSIPTNLMTIPPNIQNITIKFPENWILSFGFLDSLKMFTKLESLSLKFYHFTQIDCTFLSEIHSLKCLKLKNCSVEPMNLQKCLQNSKTKLEFLSLGNCFPQFPNIVTEDINQLDKLKELEFQFNCGTLNLASNILNRLTSLELINISATIDVNKLFIALIEHNKIQALTFNSLDTTKSLKCATLSQLHRLTNLRRLFFYESDFVNDEFLMEISKSQRLTHFTYKQAYQPKLFLDSVLQFIVVNGRKLEKCSYIVYNDVSHLDQKSEQKRELMENFRKTAAFQRILQCKEDISLMLTSVEFVFKRIHA